MSGIPAADWIVALIFVLCLGTMGIGAIIAISTARLIRSVCGLAICCFGLAGLYYFLHSPFLALMQILIYVGAVCVTIVFAVMLAEPDEPPRQESVKAALAWGGVSAAAACGIFWGIVSVGTRTNWPNPARTKEGSIADIGISLLTTYSMAFELISLALLVAILGALAVARTGRHLQATAAGAGAGTDQIGGGSTRTASRPVARATSRGASPDPQDSQLLPLEHH